LRTAFLKCVVAACVLILAPLDALRAQTKTPPDAGLLAVTPAECIAYLSSPGSRKIEPGSKNQLDQLMAEPEIQDFITELKRLADEIPKHLPPGSPEQEALGKSLPVVAKALFTRPVMAYVSKVTLPPQAPSANAAVVVNAGDELDAFLEALGVLETLYISNAARGAEVVVTKDGTATLRRLPTPPQAPPLSWGVQGNYVFLALGNNEAESLAKKVAAETAESPAKPKWLADVEATAAIPRPGTMLYVDIAGILKTTDSLLDLPLGREAEAPTSRKLVKAFGVDHIRYLAMTSGLDETVGVGKFIVGHDGEPVGLTKLLHGKPLASEELQGIPASTDMMLTGRFDAGDLFDTVFEIIEAIESAKADEAKAAIEQSNDELGFDARKELLGALGDRWTLYNSPAEGGTLATGACLSVSVRDSGKLKAALAKVLTRIKSSIRDPKLSFTVRSTKVEGHDIEYLQFGMPLPVAPAWCVTEDEFVFAIMPQMVRAHLTRPKSTAKLIDSPLVKSRFASGDVTSLSYADSHQTNEILYSYANYLVAFGAGLLEKETGVTVDLTKFPSYASISRHMQPAVSLTRSTKNAWIAESYATGPAISPSSIAVAGMGAALLLPAVSSARETGRANTSRNNIRNIMMASRNYQARHLGDKLPARAIISVDGKPLLSWRVAILPDLDRQALYEQFHLDEPWDSEHNKKLIPLMPEIYLHPSMQMPREAGRTIYQIPTGKGTLFEGFKSPTKEVMKNIDARGNTAWIVEANPAQAVEWTKPEDIELDATDPWGTLWTVQGTTNIGFLDLSVRGVSPAELAIEEVRAMLFPRFKAE
jgi:hypothetical protein